MKKIMGLALVSVLLLSLTACGDDNRGQDVVDGINLLKNFGEMAEQHENGELSDEDLTDGLINDFADGMGMLMEGSDEELSEEEIQILKDGLTAGADVVEGGLAEDADKVNEAMDRLEELDELPGDARE